MKFTILAAARIIQHGRNDEHGQRSAPKSFRQAIYVIVMCDACHRQARQRRQRAAKLPGAHWAPATCRRFANAVTRSRGMAAGTIAEAVTNESPDAAGPA